ncbi:MAG TPA: hypothetical protein VOB72_27520 [Candidatus Dormibacteraeota bacterium]|nr:hypothetical protein [Candidatus Dormibacteraeota bacterium]
MRQLAWAFAFFVFDRDAGKVRPAVIAGLIFVGLHLASDHLLRGNWMQQAGFPSIAHAPAAALPSPTSQLSTVTCRTEASR